MSEQHTEKKAKLFFDLKTGMTCIVQLDKNEKKLLGYVPGPQLPLIEFLPTLPEDTARIFKAYEQLKGVQQDKPPQGFADRTAVFVDLDPDADAKDFKIYTVAFPSQADMRDGVIPKMAVKTYPADLIAAGLAEFPKEAKDREKQAIDSKKAMEKVNALIGLKNVKEKLERQLAMSQFAMLREEVLGKSTKKPSMHMVFTGNPGTGKTTVAREYAEVLYKAGLISENKFLEKKREDLVGTHIGQSEAISKKVFEEARGGVLFIDEAYSLYVEDSEKDFGHTVINQLVAEMENHRDDLVVIVAGYEKPMKKMINSNEGLKSRFLNYIDFPDYDENEMGKIIDYMANDFNITLSPSVRAKAVSMIEDERALSKEKFGNGRTARNLLELAMENTALRVMSQEDLIEKATPQQLKKLVMEITMEDISSVNLQGFDKDKKTSSVGWNLDDMQDDFAESAKPSKPKPANDDKAVKPRIKPAAKGPSR